MKNSTMKIKISKPIYDYILKDLINKLNLEPKHATANGTDILDFSEVDATALLGRIGSTLTYLEEVKKIVKTELGAGKNG